MKTKGLHLLLSAILVLSLTACGTQNANNESSSALYNDSTISALASNSDQNIIKDNLTTKAEPESVQANTGEGPTSATELNTSTLSANDAQATEEQVTQKQSDTTPVDNSTPSNPVINNVVIDTKQEDATLAPIVGTVVQTTSQNNFSFIESAGSFKSSGAYMQYLKDSGATYVSSTADAITAIKDVCKNAQKGINLCFSSNVDIALLKSALPQDNTLSGYIDINVSECEYVYNSYYFGAKFTWWTSSSQEATVDSLVAQVLPSLNQGTTYDKIKNVHDYICNAANYSNATLTNAAQDFSAYDALIVKLAVCQGYALAFQKFMDAMGIEAYIVKGDIITSVANGSHAWNVVKLNGAWYSVDCTWDGQDDNTTYNYFLLGAKEYPYGITGGISLAASKYIK